MSVAKETRGDEQEAEDLSEVRLLFDEYEPKVTRSITILPDVEVSVVCAEQTQPGALQSGMYLWPAATALSKYVAEFLLHTYPNAHTIVELGAGCGLVGLVAARVLQQAGSVAPCVVVFTDRDRTSLKIIQQSIKACGGFGPNIRTVRKLLSWSPDAETKYPSLDGFAFDLALGSDLIYSTESALALLGTVAGLMPRDKEWSFLLSSSFRDPVTTNIVDAKCKELGIVREIVLAEYEGCLLERFHRI